MGGKQRGCRVGEEEGRASWSEEASGAGRGRGRVTRWESQELGLVEGWTRNSGTISVYMACSHKGLSSPGPPVSPGVLMAGLWPPRKPRFLPSTLGAVSSGDQV